MSPLLILLLFSWIDNSVTEYESLSHFYDSPVSSKTYLLEGETLTVLCTLNPSLLETYTAKSISFNFTSNVGMKTSCVPMPKVDTLNRSQASLILENVTVADAGTYTCFVGGITCEDEKILELVGFSQLISVEYVPRPVTNFTCVVYDWDTKMICSWRHPVHYMHKKNIAVNLTYRLPWQSENFNKCYNESYSSCSLPSSSFISNEYFIKVTVTNKRKRVSSFSTFSVNGGDIVKPSPVINLSVKPHPDKAECFLLSWEHLRIHRNKTYRVRHQESGQVLATSLNETRFVACGYEPWTKHTFIVDCLPAFPWKGYWSEPRNCTSWSAQTAPDLGPQISNGSYTSHRCQDGLRNVTFYWQETVKEARNGVIDQYILKSDGNTLARVNSTVYSASVQLSCENTVEVQLFAHNDGGYSVTPSLWTVAPSNVSVPQILRDSFAIGLRKSLNNYRLIATWALMARSLPFELTVFWCRSSLPTLCEGQISWKLVPNNQSHLDIPGVFSLPVLYQYGIAVLDVVTQGTSGIFWTGCLYQLDIDSNSVRSKEVPATVSHYAVSPLSVDKKYMVTVQSMSLGRAGNEATPWKVAIPETEVNTTSYLPWIGMIGLFIPVVFLFIFFRKVYRWRKKTIEDMMTSADNIMNPRSEKFLNHSCTERLDKGETGFTSVRPAETAQYMNISDVTNQSSSGGSCIPLVPRGSYKDDYKSKKNISKMYDVAVGECQQLNFAPDVLEMVRHPDNFPKTEKHFQAGATSNSWENEQAFPERCLMGLKETPQNSEPSYIEQQHVSLQPSVKLEDPNLNGNVDNNFMILGRPLTMQFLDSKIAVLEPSEIRSPHFSVKSDVQHLTTPLDKGAGQMQQGVNNCHLQCVPSSSSDFSRQSNFDINVISANIDGLNPANHADYFESETDGKKQPGDIHEDACNSKSLPKCDPESCDSNICASSQMSYVTGNTLVAADQSPAAVATSSDTSNLLWSSLSSDIDLENGDISPNAGSGVRGATVSAGDYIARMT